MPHTEAQMDSTQAKICEIRMKNAASVPLFRGTTFGQSLTKVVGTLDFFSAFFVSPTPKENQPPLPPINVDQRQINRVGANYSQH